MFEGKADVEEWRWRDMGMQKMKVPLGLSLFAAKSPAGIFLFIAKAIFEDQRGTVRKEGGQ